MDGWFKTRNIIYQSKSDKICVNVSTGKRCTRTGQGHINAMYSDLKENRTSGAPDRLMILSAYPFEHDVFIVIEF